MHIQKTCAVSICIQSDKSRDFSHVCFGLLFSYKSPKSRVFSRARMLEGKAYETQSYLRRLTCFILVFRLLVSFSQEAMLHKWKGRRSNSNLECATHNYINEKTVRKIWSFDRNDMWWPAGMLYHFQKASYQLAEWTDWKLFWAGNPNSYTTWNRVHATAGDSSDFTTMLPFYSRSLILSDFFEADSFIDILKM